jgi:hypothetical protein
LFDSDALVQAHSNEEEADHALDSLPVRCSDESDMITTNAKRTDDASAQAPIQARMA